MKYYTGDKPAHPSISFKPVEMLECMLRPSDIRVRNSGDLARFSHLAEEQGLK